MAVGFAPGPNLTSGEIVGPGFNKLKLLNAALGRIGIKPQLDIVTSLPDESGNISFRANLEKTAHFVGMGVSSHILPNDGRMIDTIHGLNDEEGATLALVPTQHAENIPRVIEANQRDVEGTGNSEWDPSTPRGMLDLAEHGLGHSLSAVDAPDKRISVVGYNGQVGTGVVRLLDKYYDIKPRLVGRGDDDKRRAFPDARVIFSAVGRPGLIHEGYWGPTPIGADSPEANPYLEPVLAIDAGVTLEGKKHRGDVKPGIERVVPIDYTPAVGGVGPMNVLNILLRTSILTARQNRMSDEQIAQMRANVEATYDGLQAEKSII